MFEAVVKTIFGTISTNRKSKKTTMRLKLIQKCVMEYEKEQKGATEETHAVSK